MKVCSSCQSSMERTIYNDTIYFKCHCGNEIQGTVDDLRIAGHSYNYSTEIVEKFANLVKFAMFDPINQKIKKDCNNCGLDYMTQLKLGHEEIILYVCKCGNQTSV
uniref:C122R homolog protein n=1 Tax=Abalone asfa-like virus TaxID=2839893 RepID=A0A5K7XY27_9VIRU|nr:C122R homolog protein [Abalone asfa-like virus]BCY04554.1 hypothetical protein [Abalone asfa-like virus]